MVALRLLGLLLLDVVKDLLRHRGQHLLAILSLASGLLLAGGGLLGVEALDRWIGRMESLARVTVFASEGASLDEATAKLRLDPRFQAVRRVSSEEATKAFLAISRESGLMLQSLGGEKIPENLELTLRPEFAASGKAVEVGETLRSLPGVGDVIVDQERLQAFQRSARLIRGALSFLGAILLIGAAFSTGNVIRMAILAREEEITIMRLVGATEAFIRTPIVLEGAVLGLGASCLALTGLWGLWWGLARGIGGLPPLLVELARLGFFSWKGWLLLMGLGTITGALGAWWGFQATRRAERALQAQMEHPAGNPS